MDTFFLTIILTIAYCIIKKYREDIMANKEYIRQLYERNDRVAEFRRRVGYMSHDLYTRLPDWETMFYDNKPLSLESYFEEINN